MIAWLIDIAIISGIDALIEVSVDACLTTGFLQLVATTAYFFGFWLTLGATPGKLLLGLRIVMVNGGRLSAKGALLRYAAQLLSAVLFVPAVIGYSMIAFRADKRALHDLIAGTMVIRAR